MLAGNHASMLGERGHVYFEVLYRRSDGIFFGAYGTSTNPMWAGYVQVKPSELKDECGGKYSYSNPAFQNNIYIVVLNNKLQTRCPVSGKRLAFYISSSVKM